MNYLNSYLEESTYSNSNEDEEFEYSHIIGDQSRIESVKFNLNLLNDSYSIGLFRFTVCDIIQIHEKLQLPDEMILTTRSRISSLIAFAIVLRRLVYPNRLGDLVSLFGRCKSDLSGFIKVVVHHIIQRFGHLLRWDQRRITSSKYVEFATAINQKQSRLNNCVGFIDGTIRGICKPSYPNRIYYNGHKRLYCIKFQNICSPDGIIIHMSGGWYGSRHDSFMLKASQVVPFLRNELNRDGLHYTIYGDAGYPRKDILITPFRGHNLSPDEKDFNDQMKTVRICVEWTFQKIIALWAFLDFKKNLKLRLQPVGEYYQLATILSNIHTCLYGSETSNYFNLETPSIDDYLNYFFCVNINSSNLSTLFCSCICILYLLIPSIL